MQKLKAWLKRATRIVGMDPKTFEQFWVFRLNNLQLISSIILLLLTFTFIVYLLFSYTPLSNVLPFGGTYDSRKEVEQTYERLAALDKQIENQSNYIRNLQNVILGRQVFDSIYTATSFNDSLFLDLIDTARTAEERKLEADIKSKISDESQPKERRGDLFLLDPIVGTVSQKFKGMDHPGVDIIAEKNTPIMAIYEGKVIHAGYDEKDGFTMILSHPTGIISIYKHCDKLLKKVGESVRGGDPIAIIGNTGSRSSGPHLHFELWSTTGLLNPLDYFSFGK
jgi:murein DD-endopeptidase MepM/ murein hydrolase activator NlpD